MSVRVPGKNFADVFLRLLWMLQIFPPGTWLKPRHEVMAGDEARDMVSRRKRFWLIYIT